MPRQSGALTLGGRNVLEHEHASHRASPHCDCNCDLSVTVERIRGRRLQRIRREHLQREPLCVLCARKQVVRAGTEVDHVIPLFKGGADDETNRQTLCDECHKAKTRQDLGQKDRIEFDANGLPINGAHHWNRM